MIRVCAALIFLFTLTLPAVGQELPEVQPWFVSAKANAGKVMQTITFLSGAMQIPFYHTESLSAGLRVRDGSLMDRTFGDPYFGIGISHYEFYRDADLGAPWSVCLQQGATPWHIASWLSGGYEVGLGVAWGWVPYNINVKPQNMAIGSKAELHLSANLFLRWNLARNLWLDTGGAFNHFSNGDLRIPNNGLNTLSGFAALGYNFDAGKTLLHDDSHAYTRKPPRRFLHDVTIATSVRGVKFVDTTGTKLSLRYYNAGLRVWNASYSFMKVSGWRYLWGPSVDFTYDESAGVRGYAEQDPVTGLWADRFFLAPFKDRLTLGLSMKGEMVMPYYGAYAQLGYEVVRSPVNHRDEPARFYQIIGVKFFPVKSVFCTFAVRATQFSSAQYFLFGAGYRFGL